LIFIEYGSAELEISGADMAKLSAGDWVEVRSKEEILRTLDKSGRMQGLPFKPQTFKYCGQRFQVYKRAHKTCDTVNPIAGRRLADGIHLSLRCDGQAYGGCQAACLIFWKEGWLKPVDAEGVKVQLGASDLARSQAASCTSCGKACWGSTSAWIAVELTRPIKDRPAVGHFPVVLRS
jgi:hypothetical protein